MTWTEQSASGAWSDQALNEHIRCTEDGQIRCTEDGVTRICLLDERVSWNEPAVSTTWTEQ